MIIGLDASTTTVGWAFSEDGKILDAGFLDISPFDSNKEKSIFVINFLKSNPNFRFIKSINLESALSGFAGGRTTQQTIIKLARFNAVFEYILTEELHLNVNLCNVNTMRKQLFGKCRVKGIKPKDYVKMNITQYIDTEKFDKKKKRGSWDERNGDMYDAVVTALYKPIL
jgi:hypothetical protein